MIPDETTGSCRALFLRRNEESQPVAVIRRIGDRVGPSANIDRPIVFVAKGSRANMARVLSSSSTWSSGPAAAELIRSSVWLR